MEARIPPLPVSGWAEPGREVAGRAVDGPELHVFATFARHLERFVRRLPFAGKLLLAGTLAVMWASLLALAPVGAASAAALPPPSDPFYAAPPGLAAWPRARSCARARST